MDHTAYDTGRNRFAVAPEADSEPASPSVPRVLFVDDDTLVRETLGEHLRELGFAMMLARGGEEALALLDAGAEVDALLSDLTMPGIDGLETIRQARRRRPGLPCLLLTGYAGDRIGGAEAASFRLVRKPISGAALAAHLRAHLPANPGPAAPPGDAAASLAT